MSRVDATVAGDRSANDDGGIAPFLAVWLPSFLVVIATGLATFGMNWWLSRGPHGGAQLGVIVGIASAVSLVSVAGLSGVLDRADRRGAVVRLLLTLAVPLFALIVVFGTAQSALAVVAAGFCYVLVQTLQSLYLATMETVGVDLAPDRWPGARTAMLTQMQPQVDRVVSPAVAGVLVAAGALQAVPLVGLGVVVVVGVLVLAFRRHLDGVTARVAARQSPAAHGRNAVHRAFQDAVESARLIRSHRDLVFLVWFGILVNLVVFPFYAVLPAYIREYGLSERAQAVLYSRAATAYGIGMLTGTLLLVRHRHRAGTRRSLAVATACFALMCLVLLATTVVPWPNAVIVTMVVNGGLFVVLIAVGGAVWLNRTPAEVRVRVFSLRRLTVFSSIPVGTMLMGFGGSLVGYRSFLRLLLGAVLLGLCAAWFLGYRRSDRAAADLDQ
jgi:MFS family permease